MGYCQLMSRPLKLWVRRREMELEMKLARPAVDAEKAAKFAETVVSSSPPMLRIVSRWPCFDFS